MFSHSLLIPETITFTSLLLPHNKNHNLFISRSIQSTDWWENHLCGNAAFKANQSKCGTKDEFSYKSFNKLLMIEALLLTTRRSQANKGLICKMLETYWEILKITHCSYYLCLECRQSKVGYFHLEHKIQTSCKIFKIQGSSFYDYSISVIMHKHVIVLKIQFYLSTLLPKMNWKINQKTNKHGSKSNVQHKQSSHRLRETLRHENTSKTSKTKPPMGLYRCLHVVDYIIYCSKGLRD